MKNLTDKILIFAFVVMLFVTALFFAYSRVFKNSSAIASNTAYYLQTKELQVKSELNTLRASYASRVLELKKLKSEINELSVTDVEKTERLTQLQQVYSQDYFDKLEKRISEKNAELNEIINKKCEINCAF